MVILQFETQCWYKSLWNMKTTNGWPLYAQTVSAMFFDRMTTFTRTCFQQCIILCFSLHIFQTFMINGTLKNRTAKTGWSYFYVAFIKVFFIFFSSNFSLSVNLLWLSEICILCNSLRVSCRPVQGIQSYIFLACSLAFM